MLNALRKHTLPVLVFGMAVIYALQFLICPLCFPQYYPVSNEAWFVLLFPLIIFSTLMNILADTSAGSWAVADIAYCILAVLYNGAGLYGIGKRGVALDGMEPIYSIQLAAITIVFFGVMLFLFQMLLRVIKGFIPKTKKK